VARTGRPTALHSRLKDEPWREGDGREGQWAPHQLHAMDRKFVQRVERAIELGQEQPMTSANGTPASHLK
jgi:hypothetical protein